ncbi:hypothetical protein XarbCFBP7604_02445 [Xanthomonas arboricola]|nr:hypothetical protein XarbCFBP7614_13790 [Xanthomonas arboricola]PPU32878.1 hypothetical protein XarbCFBP7604_02445 [Xanthomonas arboricola]
MQFEQQAGFRHAPYDFLSTSRRSGNKQVFHLATGKFPSAVSLPIAGPLAAWMPPSSLHGRIHGVSHER